MNSAFNSAARKSKSAAIAGGTWAYRNPTLAGSAAIAATGAGLVLAPAVASVPILSGLGFGAGGVQAASIAAGVQSGIGNVVAGSAFATAQSAAAGGSGAVIVNGAVQAAGVTMAAGGAALGWLKGRNSSESAEKPEEDAASREATEKEAHSDGEE